MADDFFNMVTDFYKSGKITRGCNTLFVVLIPNKDSPVGLNDYRLISLVGCIYKVLVKLLAERLGQGHDFCYFRYPDNFLERKEYS